MAELPENRFLRLPRVVRLAMGLLLVVLTLAGIEFGCYRYLRRYDEARGGASEFAPMLKGRHPLFRARDPLSDYVFDPYLGFRNRASHRVSTTLATDASGFIKSSATAADVALAKSPGVIRVFLLGGSSVAGSGLTNETTIASQLGRYLNRPGSSRRYEVINAGVSSYTSAMELVYLQLYLLRYDPDIVITLDGWNDFFLSSNQGERHDEPQWIPYHYRMRQTFDWVQSPLGTSGILAGHLRSRLFTAAVLDLLTRSAHAPVSPVESRPSYSLAYAPSVGALRDYANNLRSVAGSTQSNGIRSLIALQPNVVTRTPPVEDELTLLAPISSRASYRTSAQQWFQSARAQFAAMQAAKQGADVAFLDLTDTFDGRREVMYSDFVHYNAAGAGALAERLGSEIEKRLRPDGVWAWSQATDATATYSGTPAIRIDELVGEKTVLEGYDRRSFVSTGDSTRVSLKLYWSEILGTDRRARKRWSDEGFWRTLENGDFEGGVVGKYPKGWTAEVYGNAAADGFIARTEGEDGKPNRAMVLKTAGTTIRLGLQSTTVKVEPGDQFLIAGRARSAAGSGQLGAVWQGPGVKDEFRYHWVLQSYDGSDWRHFATIVKPVNGASQFVLWAMNIKPESTVWFDDIIVVKLKPKR